ncbi:MAG: branched-chain amino acid ABC transporter permease [Clostridiales bacterium]|nr:branched-chain amino acid ABC transporter permease [Clostridiales bacterium]
MKIEGKTKEKKLSCIQYAFRQSVPVMLGYIFLGIAFGLMLQDAGYHFLWAFVISIVVYAGSMQFVMVTLLSSGASLLYTAVMTLFINGRHIFYGFSFIEKYPKMGKVYPYMVFSLTDETYSVLCRAKVPSEIDEKKVMFYISFLDQCYWVVGSTIGGLAGQLITFNSTGIDFSMTALFVAIVVEQWQESKSHVPAVAGFLMSLLFLLIFGADRFILPSLLMSVIILVAARKHLEKEEEKEKNREMEGRAW